MLFQAIGWLMACTMVALGVVMLVWSDRFVEQSSRQMEKWRRDLPFSSWLFERIDGFPIPLRTWTRFGGVWFLLLAAVLVLLLLREF